MLMSPAQDVINDLLLAHEFTKNNIDNARAIPHLFNNMDINYPLHGLFYIVLTRRNYVDV